VDPGTILEGQYEVVEEMGRGGMGIIYRARDTRLGRTVAVKTLTSDLRFDENAKERFIHEARAASALDHPNICSVLDIGEAPDGQIFVVMTYYEGHTLKSHLEQARLSLDEALDIGTQLASALERAHEAGIVHRDVKPSNIQITDRAEVKLLDFGVAKLATERALTQTGVTLGTVGYSSPEQLATQTADYRADLWSLGVILYEMLSGRKPFVRSSNVATAAAVLHSEPEPLSELVPDLPGPVLEIVDLCLQKDPGSRPADAGTIRRVLARSQSARFAGQGPRPEAGRLERTNRWLLAAAIVAAVAAATALLLSI
jgi:serine/threonine-protein kinase